MFDNRKIRRIRSLPEGKDILLTWIMLLTTAGKCNANGYIFFTENIPYDEEMLSIEFDIPINNIKLALAVLQKYNMVNCDNQGFFIKNWSEYQSIEGLDKIREQTRNRVANYREKQKLLMPSKECQYCGGEATGYDHVIATARGGTDTDDNKIPCCIECNRIKNDKPLVNFLNDNRKRINDRIVLSNSILSKHVTLCNVTNCYEVTQCNAIEVDIELDKEIDTDIDINNTYCPESTDSAPRTAIPYKQIIDYLNSKAHTKYSPTTQSTKQLIKARINEGRTIDDFKKVIDLKTAEWMNDEKMLPYLRPETLFNGKHFESYLNQKAIPAGQAVVKNQKKNNFSNYTQREYGKGELESRLLDDDYDDEAFQKAIASRKNRGGGICV